MSWTIQKCTLFSLLMSAHLSTVYASHYSLSAAGGATWLNTNDTHLVVSSFETDKNIIDSTSVGGTGKVGIGYYLYQDYLLLELNVYYASNDLKGDVWQYELPQFNNYDFDATLSSTRLMLDFKPFITKWERFAPYLILGVGVTWNTASYDETVVASGVDSNSALSLSDHTQTELAFDAGLGLSAKITEQISLTAEYIYAFLGDAQPDNDSSNGRTLDEAPSFSYQIQNVLVGFNIKF